MSVMAPQPGLRILFVEDNEEIRDALVTLLQAEGYDVASTSRAEEGLHLLRTAGPFHLVITDFSLPGKTGTWMVKEALRDALVRSTQVLVVTAHPTPSDADGLKVIQKPLDLDDFLGVVHKLLAPARAVEMERARTQFEAELRALGLPPPQPVELYLYISSSSPSSYKAVRKLHQLLTHYDPAQIRLRVSDLSREGSRDAEQDHVAFTPTLVKRSPGPRTWILGDLGEASLVEEMLASAGVERTK